MLVERKVVFDRTSHSYVLSSSYKTPLFHRHTIETKLPREAFACLEEVEAKQDLFVRSQYSDAVGTPMFGKHAQLVQFASY